MAEAVGILEVFGLATAFVAADAGCKAVRDQPGTGQPDGKKDTHTDAKKSTIIKQMVVSVKAYKRQ